jgi:hypothetical protein
MATNKRDLKAYSRFDGTGRIVPGSTVLRRNKPKVGNWKETQAYECCNNNTGCSLPPVLLSYNISEVSFSTTIYFYLYCNDVIILTTSATPADSITPEQYVESLNSTLGWTGVFTLNGDVIDYELNGCLAPIMCSEGELTFSVTNPVGP